MSSGKTRLQQAVKELKKAQDARYSKTEAAITVGAVGSAYVAIDGNMAKAQLPSGTTGEIEVVNTGRPASAIYAPKSSSGATVVRNISTVTGSGSDAAIAQAIAVHKAETDPHPIYLTQTEADALYTTEYGTAQYQVPVTGASPYLAAYTGLSTFAGDGLTFGGAFAVGAGTLIGVTANAVNLANGSAQYQVIATGASPFTPAYTALSAFAGDGLVFSGGLYAVNRDADSGLTFAMSGALRLGTPISSSATSTNSVTGIQHSHAVDSTIARSAITFSASGLGLSGGGNLTANRTYMLTSDSDPGANASILASDASGKLTLPLYVATTSVTTPILTASSGLSITATGDITLDAGGNDLIVGASNTLKTANYASQTTGWGIDYAGGADFRYLFTDELHAKSFIADLEQALAGGQIISKSVAVLAINFTAPAAGGTATLRVKDLPSAANMAVFQSGDIVRLRTFSRASGALSITDCWGTVTSYADQSDGTQTWTFTRSTSTNAGAMTTGTVVNADSIVLDYGTTGNGIYEVNAIDGAYAANSPYWQIASWSGHPATGQTVNVRGGKLTGITSVANEYGLFAGTGSTASDSYIRVSSYAQESNNLASTWKTGGSTFLSIDATNGAQIESVNSLTSSNQRAYSFTIAGAESGGLYHYYNSTYTEAVMMLNQSSASRNNNIFVQTESDSGKNSRIYLEAKETTQATAYIDLQADVGGNASGIQMGAYTISAYTSQILVKYANGSGGDGFASAPVYSFVDDTNTGIYRSAADTLNISTGGASRVTINNTSLSVHQNTNNPSYVGYAQVGYIGHAGYAGFAHTSSATASAYALIQHSTGETYLNAATTKRIHFRNNNAEVMNMSDVGLRIGDSTTPTEALEVAGTIYTSNRLVAGEADLSSNVSKFTGRYSTQSGISLTATSWGLASAVLFNAYQADTSVRLSASGGCKYLGAQYTGNVTAPGMFYYDANANRFEWWIGEQGLASGANITSWQQQLQLDSAGKMTLFGDLEWSSGGFAAAWTALTYNTNWSSYGSPYGSARYCQIGDLVLVNGLVTRTSGNTTTTVATLPSGYRPATQKSWETRMSIGGVEGAYRIDVTPTGAISITYTGTAVIDTLSLDCIQFRTNS